MHEESHSPRAAPVRRRSVVWDRSGFKLSRTTFMAKDVSISARDLNGGLPDLATWLTRDLRVVGGGPTETGDEARTEAVLPPPPLDEPEVAPEPAPIEAEAAAVPDATSPASDVGVEMAAMAAMAIPAAFAPDLQPSDGDAAPAEHAEEDGASERVAAGSDWSSEDDDFFTSSPEATDEDSDDELFAPAGVLADVASGPSLSPQVIESEGGDADVPLVIPGTGRTAYWKVVAGVAAAALLAFFFMHRVKPHTEAAAQKIPPAALEAPTPASAALVQDELGQAGEEPQAKGATKGGGSSAFGGRHSPPAAGQEDPSPPGGPSVARFPDLPRDILNALEQAFESGDGTNKAKPKADSVGGY
jgi:hypothetical protein